MTISGGRLPPVEEDESILVKKEESSLIMVSPELMYITV
jgi:hypothetical protein